MAWGVIERPSRARAAGPAATDGDAGAALTGERHVFFHEQDDFATTRIYSRSRLAHGARVSGPAIVEQMDSTVLVRPGMSAVVDQFGNLILDTSGASPDANGR